jgi:hypothetical protein
VGTSRAWYRLSGAAGQRTTARVPLRMTRPMHGHSKAHSQWLLSVSNTCSLASKKQTACGDAEGDEQGTLDCCCCCAAAAAAVCGRALLGSPGHRRRPLSHLTDQDYLTDQDILLGRDCWLGAVSFGLHRMPMVSTDNACGTLCFCLTISCLTTRVGVI